MKIGQASGLQVAFLAFGVMLLAVPLAGVVVREAGLEGAFLVLAEKGAHFFLASILIVAIPPIRRAVAEMLGNRIPPSMRLEVLAIGLLKLATGFGVVAALALWYIARDGAAWINAMTRDVDRLLANAYTPPALVLLALSSTLGPIIEEIVFRGFLYRAFERQWGWVVSLVATSALFGVFHPNFWSAFTASVILICLLRRTGSLRAPILVHMTYNFLLWPPLLGQYVLPKGATLTDPPSWIVHGACLALAMVAVPVYVYMSRERPVAPTLFLEPNGALQK